MEIMIGIAIVLFACFIGTPAPILVKKGSERLAWNLRSIIFNGYLLGGILLFVVSSVLFISSLRFGEVSVLYPFASTSYIWISLLSIKYLDEKMNKHKWAGIGLIILGVSLIGLGAT